MMGKYLRRLIAVAMLLIGGIHTSHAQIDTERVISVGQNAIYFKDYVLAIHSINSAIELSPCRTLLLPRFGKV